MITVKQMYDDLDYWIHIGIGDDIIKLPNHRPEYQHLVRKFWSAEDPLIIQAAVLESLKRELQKPWFMRPTFYQILKLKLMRKI